MSALKKRQYAQSVQGIVFDWAGTTVDFGSRAPLQAFLALFKANGVEITEVEAREPMGLGKREHIACLLDMPRIAKAWEDKHGKKADDADIDRLYEDFLPHQLEAIDRTSNLLPGAMDIIKELKDRGCKIGSNTGYARVMVDKLAPLAAKQGYTPDSIITASDVARGRPFPDMLWKNLLEMGVEQAAAAVKVDDTTVGITAGLNAGCWTVGVTISGNGVGLSLEDWEALDEAKREEYRAAAKEKFIAAGAHYVIDSIADILPVIDDINARLAAGECP